MTNFTRFRDTQQDLSTQRTVFLASSFRTGSTLLGRLLEQQTGLALQREVFNGTSTWFNRPEPALWREITKTLTPADHGIFATKLMWPHRNLLARFLGLDPVDASAFLRAFVNPSMIYLFRRDSVAQAVSYHIARQTGIWESGANGTTTPDQVSYSFDRINTYYMHFLSFDQLWADFAAATQARPLVLYYEDMTRDLEASVRLVLDHLDLPFIAGRWSDQPPLTRQSNTVSDAFCARFRDDLHRYSARIFLPDRLGGPADPL